MINDDQLRAVTQALVLRDGPDRPQRDFEQGPVLVRPCLDQRARGFDRPVAGLGHLPDLPVLDDNHAVVLGEGRGCLARRLLPATAYSACNLETFRLAFSRLREPFCDR